MKRVIGIALLSLYMLAYGEGHQFLRIPFLVKHYQTHRQADPEMGLRKFFHIHYIVRALDDDFNQDKELPFRNCDCVQLAISIVKFDPVAIDIVPPPSPDNEFFCFNELNISQIDEHDFFQPPRRA